MFIGHTCKIQAVETTLYAANLIKIPWNTKFHGIFYPSRCFNNAYCQLCLGILAHIFVGVAVDKWLICCPFAERMFKRIMIFPSVLSLGHPVKRWYKYLLKTFVLALPSSLATRHSSNKFGFTHSAEGSALAAPSGGFFVRESFALSRLLFSVAEIFRRHISLNHKRIPRQFLYQRYDDFYLHSVITQMYIKSARFYTGKIKKSFFFRGKIVLYQPLPYFRTGIECLVVARPANNYQE